ncbi:unnamed protein product [Absidia cylindrospora]
MADIIDDTKKIAQRRIKAIASHLTNASFIETLQLGRNADQLAYITPLDPLRFLLRSAMVYTNKTAVVHQGVSYTYRQLAERTLQLANGLLDDYGVQVGDRVGVLCQNIPAVIEAHYAIPAAGAIMVPLNTRLASAEIDYVLGHAGCSVLLVQQYFFDSNQVSAASLAQHFPQLHVIVIADTPTTPLNDPYEVLLNTHVSSPRLWNQLPLVNDENAVLSINYTSGSTGRPKGVMVTYRGAYIAALNYAIHDGLSSSSVMLWTLPMFHCNGWGFMWSMVAVGGTQLMLNKIDYDEIWKALKEKGVTHYNGAPTIQNEICSHPEAQRLAHPVQVLSGGAALSSPLIKRMLALNLQPKQVYGLTETYGPNTMSYEPWHLADKPIDAQHTMMARQGFNTIAADEIRVLDRISATDVPTNGTTVGEICCSGNLNMKGYYNNPQETEKAFRAGFFWTGDLAVRHPDGSIEIVDRGKDVIVSGGENISSLEVESVIVQLDQVSECAVVGGPDEKWGERPYAYVVLKSNQVIEPNQIITHCRNKLAGYKCPSKVFLVPSIPKTSTGKTQKYVIRNELWKGKDKKIQG